ncbi:MAG: SCO family protein [Burkholderiales bacterium]|nr:SCO family protein [Burkholderiales bacterium]
MDRRRFLTGPLGCGALAPWVDLAGSAQARAGGQADRREAADDEVNARLPTIGTAPPFALTDQDGRRLALADMRGKVLALTFIYTVCSDSCPLLTARLATLQDLLGAAFGPRLRFVSISVLPEYDTPAILRDYARSYRANLRGWSFLTGSAEGVQAAVRGYGSYAARNRAGQVDHLTLTSLVDKLGRLRVQYLGTRFRDDELLRDLRALLAE